MTNLAEAIQNACEIARQDERKKFKEYLEKKLDEATEKAYSSRIFNIGAIIKKDVYEEIINEFFKED